jgi:hypothetical protein
MPVYFDRNETWKEITAEYRQEEFENQYARWPFDAHCRKSKRSKNGKMYYKVKFLGRKSGQDICWYEC